MGQQCIKISCYSEGKEKPSGGVDLKFVFSYSWSFRNISFSFRAHACECLISLVQRAQDGERERAEPRGNGSPRPAAQGAHCGPAGSPGPPAPGIPLRLHPPSLSWMRGRNYEGSLWVGSKEAFSRNPSWVKCMVCLLSETRGGLFAADRHSERAG